MRETTTQKWLDALASAQPAPGGGAAAGMNAALGAALISMVCNLTIGKPKYAESEEAMKVALQKAEAHRQTAIDLAEADADAFAAVSAAYKLPKDTDEEKAARTAAIQAALVAAAEVPLQVAQVSARIIALAGSILNGSNPNVVSDIGVAASSAKSALESAAYNVDINVKSIKDPEQRERLAAELNEALASKVQAEAIMDAVLRRIRA
ncbi:cyclodeaminase/cyclohydrolase family protein [Natronoglycomyces albus]|uniref:Cyclodeaminase/cyclohydrolase family protein n=1 Tax=Natronoglycomyces albus TaxID=2811108 RepID=A0A895XUY2_9ACTN|nr:cyclodeaminase/cyclohydrolase family protein [Natronoglycomyces albus]QSB06336.1 cyclodeaminase/cyclohydrolase family protein [Natronoglycomyces albus]